MIVERSKYRVDCRDCNYGCFCDTEEQCKSWIKEHYDYTKNIPLNSFVDYPHFRYDIFTGKEEE